MLCHILGVGFATNDQSNNGQKIGGGGFAKRRVCETVNLRKRWCAKRRDCQTAGLRNSGFAKGRFCETAGLRNVGFDAIGWSKASFRLAEGQPWAGRRPAVGWPQAGLRLARGQPAGGWIFWEVPSSLPPRSLPPSLRPTSSPINMCVASSLEVRFLMMMVTK